MKKALILLSVLLLFPFYVYAQEASNISSDCLYAFNSNVIYKLNDNNTNTNIELNENDILNVTSNSNIKYLYITYEIQSQTGVLTSNSETTSIGNNGFIHEFISLNKESNNINIKYNGYVSISEISAYSNGDVPSNIQIWQKTNKADLMLFSTHGDDEQLFFAGLIPTYINQGKTVQVVYLAKHDNTPCRYHEQLNGLWALGVKNYPVFGIIPDAYSLSLEGAISNLNKANISLDDIIYFQTKQIRTYNPKVIVGHDENGEYEHGQHILNTYALKEAINKAQDETYTVDNLSKVSIQKVYLHLYDDDNKTILNYDIPLENYDNKTAYEVAKEGYLMHESQQYTWFTKWLNGYNTPYTSAAQITKYNPSYYGLYYTNVGNDINKNDLFENVIYEKETVIKKTNATKVKKVKNKINTNIYLALIPIFTLIILLVIIIKKKRSK